MAAISQHRLHRCARCRELENTQRMPSRRSPSIKQFRSSKRTPLVFSVAFSIFKLPSMPVRGREFLWDRAAQLVPKRNAARFNSALMDLGALICIQRAPQCGICPVKMFCRASNPETLPRKKPRAANEKSRGDSRLHQKLVASCSSNRSPLARNVDLAAAEIDGLKPSRSWSRAQSISVFPFTNHRVTLRVFRAKAPRKRMIGRNDGFRSRGWIQFRYLLRIDAP